MKKDIIGVKGAWRNMGLRLKLIPQLTDPSLSLVKQNEWMSWENDRMYKSYLGSSMNEKLGQIKAKVVK